MESQDRIAKDIEGTHPDFTLLFLDHCIRELKNNQPDVHDKFVKKYIEKIQRLMHDKELPNTNGNEIPSLKGFLTLSKYYRPDLVVEYFPKDCICIENNVQRYSKKKQLF